MTAGAIDLRAVRRDRGLLMKEVAQELDISEAYLSMIEQRQRVPRPPIARRIADFYGHSVTEIWPEPQTEVAA